MEVSAVVPTCNRPERLRALLANLAASTHPLREVVVVDSSDSRLGPATLAELAPLRVVYLEAARSVCVQRNAGIRRASSPWLFLCDDDVEVPRETLARLVAHATAHPAAGAVAALFLERQPSGWSGAFPETSALVVAWKTLFELGMWGPIRARGPIGRALAAHHRRHGNHIARSGWPVITEMDGASFRTPIYSLGAALVRRDWLLASPFDESLDSHGLGDNYGVAIGFPPEGIHVVNAAPVYHHRAEANRIADGVAQERRMLALDYFIRTRAELAGARPRHLLWSLAGAGILHAASGNRPAARAMFRALARVATGRNPYRTGRGAEPLDGTPAAQP
jgi:glycosyltransferase involved in cell wall biosynthesis